MDRLKKFFINGLLMTAVTLIVRYVSVRFNIYISGKIGTVAMGVFTLVSSVYGFSITLAASGINLATTKLVSEAIGLESRKQISSSGREITAIMKKSVLFSLSISTAVAIGLFVLAEPIGTGLLGDVRTVSSIKVLAFSLPPIALSASLGGYFSALRRVYKNAAVQIFGQAARIFLCVSLLMLVSANDLESACLSLAIGITASEILAFAVQATLYALEQKKSRRTIATPSDASPSLSCRLLPITLPVALSAYMRSALITVEHLLIPAGLEKSGSSREVSLAAYGTLHSVAFPFVLFPSAISSSFAGLLVPEVSESFAARDTERIERIISRVLKTVLIYSIGIAAILLYSSRELGRIIFQGTDTGHYIALIAPLIPIMYLDTSVDSILKGLGYQLYSMIVNITDAALSVMLVWILLPRFGITGYIITVYFTELLNAALSITKLLVATKIPFRTFDWVIKPLVCAIISSKLTSFIFPFPCDKLSLVLMMITFAVIYVSLLIFVRAISVQNIKRSIINFLKG